MIGGRQITYSLRDGMEAELEATPLYSLARKMREWLLECATRANSILSSIWHRLRSLCVSQLPSSILPKKAALSVVRALLYQPPTYAVPYCNHRISMVLMIASFHDH